MEEDKKKSRLKGRPKLSEAELLKHRISFKCNSEEFDQLSRRAKIAGLSEGQFSKALVFGSQSFFSANHRETFEAFKTVAKEINPIGNNLNQLARHANVSYKEGGIDKEVYIKLNDLIGQFLEKQNELVRLNMNLLKTRK